MKFNLFYLLSALLLISAFAFACGSNTYSDATYLHVKKLFQKNETVFLKGWGIGASPQCLEQQAAKVEYYAPGQSVPQYVHTCTASTCYFPNQDSGVIKDRLQLSTSDPSGQWTAKVYRGQYTHSNHSCYWDYRTETTFNVTPFDYSCSIVLTQPENGSVVLIYSPVTSEGRIECNGRMLNPIDYYVQMEWETGVFSLPIPLVGPLGGPWTFTTNPDYDYHYSFAGEQYFKARLYKNCTHSEGEPSCDYIVATSQTVTVIVNTLPIANPGPSRNAEVGELIQFDGSGSYDPDGSIVSYHWEFGDGQGADGPIVYHAYSEPGIFTANLTVTDNLGATDTGRLFITVGAPEPSFITISPENATLVVGGMRAYSATAHDEQGHDWDVTPWTSFSSNGGFFEGNMFNAGDTVGTYNISATYGGLGTSTLVNLIRAEPTRIEISPDNASVVVGGTLQFFATAFDNYGNSWDVSSETLFNSDGGTFAFDWFTAGNVSGVFEITGTYGNFTDSVMITILHGDPVSIQVSPGQLSLPPLANHSYVSTASDEFGNEWDVTGETNFTSDGGTFEGNLLTSGTVAGDYTVSAVLISADLSDTANLTVVPGEPVLLGISPENLALPVSSSHPYYATAYDEYGNGFDVTGASEFTTDGGSFNGSTFTAGTIAGNYTAKAAYQGTEGEVNLESVTNVYVVNAQPVSLSISPENATISTGGSLAYTVTGFDSYGNQFDLTYVSNFSSPAGSFSSNVLTSNGNAGTFEVDTEYGELFAYTFVTVTAPRPPENRGGGSGSSYGFSYSSGPQPKPPEACQALDSICSATTDCCEGACLSGVCKIPEEKPPERRFVELIAPNQSDVGIRIPLLLRYSDNGEAVPDALVQVVTPSYEIISLTTDKDGAAGYAPNEEGWYDYIIPAYNVQGIVSTYVRGNVSDWGRVTIIRNGMLRRTADTSAGTGFFLMNLAPEVLGLIILVILLVAYGAYLYYQEQQEPEIQIDVEPLIPMKKIRGRKPRNPRTPVSPEEPEQPSEPQKPEMAA